MLSLDKNSKGRIRPLTSQDPVPNDPPDHPINNLILHKLVFEGNLKELSKQLWKQDINQKDHHGNTPLHLACMLGNHEIVILLLSHGAFVKIKNYQGWTPLSEAISFGNKKTVSSLLEKMKDQMEVERMKRIPNLSARLSQLKDFTFSIEWQFQSWIPFLSKILPSDNCKIYKKDNKIRLDSTLLDFSESKWLRGEVSYIFILSSNFPIVMLDHIKKNYFYIDYSSRHNDPFGAKGMKDFDDEFLMSHVIVNASVDSSHIKFDKVKVGYFNIKDKEELINGYKTLCYSLNNFKIIQKKRKEHLLEKMEKMEKKENNDTNNHNNNPIPGKLQAPPPNKVTWSQYSISPPGLYPPLGRKRVVKETSRVFKAYINMSNDFPINIITLFDLLEVMAPMKHFRKLREFLNTQLPPGFPIRTKIPLMTSITAISTFKNFEWAESLDDELFSVPHGYTPLIT